MKKKDLAVIREKDAGEILAEIEKKIAELTKTRLETKTARVKNVRVAKTLRRELAQLKTILREKILSPEEKLGKVKK